MLFQVEKLPAIDQQQIKRGMCPWCLGRLYESEQYDCCQECDDQFTGALTIAD